MQVRAVVGSSGIFLCPTGAGSISSGGRRSLARQPQRHRVDLSPLHPHPLGNDSGSLRTKKPPDTTRSLTFPAGTEEVTGPDANEAAEPCKGCSHV